MAATYMNFYDDVLKTEKVRDTVEHTVMYKVVQI